MALLWFEGFEGLGVTEGQANKDNIYAELLRRFAIFTEADTARPYLRAGETQGKSLAFQNTNTFNPTSLTYQHPNDLVGTQFVLGFRFKTSSLFTTGTYTFLQIFPHVTTTTAQIQLQFDASDNSLNLFRGGTNIASSAASVWTADTWMHIELKILIADGTGGSYEVRINDTAVIGPTSSVDTLNNSNQIAAMFVWSGYDAAGDDTEAKETLIDDIYLLDTTGSVNNDFLGANAAVVKKAPNADGTTNNFTPQSGINNFEMVDENPASSADYNDGATNGDIDEYGIPDIDETTIHGLMIETHTVPDVEGRNRKFRHRVRSGASVGNGPDFGISGDMNQQTIFEVDPNTSAAWTKTNANAAEFGVEVRD